MFPAFPKVDKPLLLRSEGGEHRQPKIILYLNCKAFLTSGKHRMEMEEIQQDPPEFSRCLNKGLSAVPFISNSINLKASDDTSDVTKIRMKT